MKAKEIKSKLKSLSSLRHRLKFEVANTCNANKVMELKRQVNEKEKELNDFLTDELG